MHAQIGNPLIDIVADRLGSYGDGFGDANEAGSASRGSESLDGSEQPETGPTVLDQRDAERRDVVGSRPAGHPAACLCHAALRHRQPAQVQRHHSVLQRGTDDDFAGAAQRSQPITSAPARGNHTRSVRPLSFYFIY